jgi:DNA-binding transcriptional ArsR family regulator
VTVFAVLADPVRRDILIRLADGPQRVVDLAAQHPISRPAISRHLRLLGAAGLVSADDRGRERHYCLEPGPLHEVVDFLAQLTTGPGVPIPESALDALDTEVRRTARERRLGTIARDEGIA